MHEGALRILKSSGGVTDGHATTGVYVQRDRPSVLMGAFPEGNDSVGLPHTETQAQGCIRTDRPSGS